MTDYVNNYLEPVTLAMGVTSLDLGLPDGEYLLTLTDSQSAPTRWEIVQAVVVSGTATLTRAQEGTADQMWPAGSVIYCTLTAGGIAALGGGGDTGWLDLPLEPGISYGPQYRKVGGVVHLRGFVYVPYENQGDALGYLPEGCRPNLLMFKDIIMGNDPFYWYRINIHANGKVEIAANGAGRADYFIFDFYSFPAG